MSYYTNDPTSCRVDFWKESGKWYDTITVKFRNKDWNRNVFIYDALINALRDTVPNSYHGLRATCLEPYHEISHPISLIWEG